MSAVSGNLVVKSKLSSRKLALQPCRSWNSSTKRDHIFFKVFALFYNILIHSVRLMEWAWEVQARNLNSDIPKKRQAWQEKKKTEIMTVTKYAGFQGNATIPVKTREKKFTGIIKEKLKMKWFCPYQDPIASSRVPCWLTNCPFRMSEGTFTTFFWSR